ncbi:MAG: hypothetical protein EOO17_01770 [Chloroflexi bacterium]|nr:MAG: hypothetical protein EOO17_01770 [Chloroflexota bacterium]
MRDPEHPDAMEEIKHAQDAFALFDVIYAMFIDVAIYDKWMADLVEDMTLFGRECTLRHHLAREQAYARKAVFALRNRIQAVVDDPDTRMQMMHLIKKEAMAHCDAYAASCYTRVIDGQNSRIKIAVTVARLRLQDRLTFKK